MKLVLLAACVCASLASPDDCGGDADCLCQFTPSLTSVVTHQAMPPCMDGGDVAITYHDPGNGCCDVNDCEVQDCTYTIDVHATTAPGGTCTFRLFKPGGTTEGSVGNEFDYHPEEATEMGCGQTDTWTLKVWDESEEKYMPVAHKDLECEGCEGGE